MASPRLNEDFLMQEKESIFSLCEDFDSVDVDSLELKLRQWTLKIKERQSRSHPVSMATEDEGGHRRCGGGGSVLGEIESNDGNLKKLTRNSNVGGDAVTSGASSEIVDTLRATLGEKDTVVAFECGASPSAGRVPISDEDQTSPEFDSSKKASSVQISPTSIGRPIPSLLDINALRFMPVPLRYSYFGVSNGSFSGVAGFAQKRRTSPVFSSGRKADAGDAATKVGLSRDAASATVAATLEATIDGAAAATARGKASALADKATAGSGAAITDVASTYYKSPKSRKPRLKRLRKVKRPSLSRGLTRSDNLNLSSTSDSDQASIELRKTVSLSPKEPVAQAVFESANDGNLQATGDAAAPARSLRIKEQHHEAVSVVTDRKPTADPMDHAQPLQIAPLSAQVGSSVTAPISAHVQAPAGFGFSSSSSSPPTPTPSFPPVSKPSRDFSSPRSVLLFQTDTQFSPTQLSPLIPSTAADAHSPPTILSIAANAHSPPIISSIAGSAHLPPIILPTATDAHSPPTIPSTAADAHSPPTAADAHSPPPALSTTLNAVSPPFVPSTAADAQSPPTPSPELPIVRRTRNSGFPAVTLPVNENSFRFQFAHIESPASFFVQPFPDDLADIAVNLNNFYDLYERRLEVKRGKPFFTTEKSFEPRVGNLVAELAEDLTSIYRSFVLDMNLRNRTFLLQRVDYGVTDWRPIHFIGELPFEFMNQPPQAVHCCLQGVRPVNAVNGRPLPAWTSAASAFFRHLVVDHRHYEAFTDAKELRLDLDICVNSVPIIVVDTDDDFIFQEKFVERGVGVMDIYVPEGNPELPSQGVENQQQANDSRPLNDIEEEREQELNEKHDGAGNEGGGMVASVSNISLTSSSLSFAPLIDDQPTNPDDRSSHLRRLLADRLSRVKIPDACIQAPNQLVFRRSKYGQWHDGNSSRSPAVEVPVRSTALEAPRCPSDASTAALRSPSPAPAAAPCELIRWNPMEEEWGSQRNNYACDVDNAGVAIDGFVVEQRPVCKYFQMGRCRLISCKNAHVDPSGAPGGMQGGARFRPTEFTLPSGKKLSDNPCLNVTETLKGRRFTLREGQLYAVSVTAVVSPTRFFIVLPFGDCPFGEHSDPTPRSLARGSFEIMHREMQTHYGSRGRGSRTRTSLKMLTEGDVIAARYPNDDKWYRAKILQVDDDEWSNTRILVEYCDFGFEAQLTYNDVRDLEPNFLLLPFQAAQFRLADLKPAPSDAGAGKVRGEDDECEGATDANNNNNPDNGYVTSSDLDRDGNPDGWSRRAKRHFLKLVQGRPLLALVRHVVGPHHYVELFGMENINHLMKAAGFAVSTSFPAKNAGGRRISLSPGFLPQPG